MPTEINEWCHNNVPIIAKSTHTFQRRIFQRCEEMFPSKFFGLNPKLWRHVYDIKHVKVVGEQSFWQLLGRFGWDYQATPTPRLVDQSHAALLQVNSHVTSVNKCVRWMMDVLICASWVFTNELIYDVKYVYHGLLGPFNDNNVLRK